MTGNLVSLQWQILQMEILPWTKAYNGAQMASSWNMQNIHQLIWTSVGLLDPGTTTTELISKGGI